MSCEIQETTPPPPLRARKARPPPPPPPSLLSAVVRTQRTAGRRDGGTTGRPITHGPRAYTRRSQSRRKTARAFLVLLSVVVGFSFSTGLGEKKNAPHCKSRNRAVPQVPSSTSPALPPQLPRTTPEALPHHSRTTPAQLPHYSQTTPALLPHCHSAAVRLPLPFWSFWPANSEPGWTRRKNNPLGVLLKPTRPIYVRFCLS